MLTGPTTTDPPKFSPEFLELLKPFSFLRGMDWTGTNGSGFVNFEDCPRPDSITYNGGDTGIAAGSWRDFFELCNAAGKDAYVCLPHRATTQAVQKIAAEAKATLEARRKCRVEYSNETWNVDPRFTQTRDLQAESEALVAAGDTALSNGAINQWEWRWRLHARRTAQMGKAFADTLGRDRTVIVLGCHGEESWWSNRMLEFLQAQGLIANIDEIAIAPYMGEHGACTTRPARTVDEIFAGGGAGREDIPGLLSDQQCSAGWNDRGKQHQAIADRWGKRLIFYEYGIYLANSVVVVGNDRVGNPTVLAAQADARMGDVVKRYESFIPPGIPRGWFILATEGTNVWGSIVGDNKPTAKYNALSDSARGN